MTGSFTAAIFTSTVLGLLAVTPSLAQTNDVTGQPEFIENQSSGSDSTIYGSGDNLGDHLARDDLNMDGNALIGLPAPGAGSSATPKWYVDNQINNGVSSVNTRIDNLDLGDDLGNHVARRSLNMAGHNVSNANGYYYTSDRRLKAGVTPFDGGLDLVGAFTPVRFTWNASGKDAWGFIAQDVRKVAPHMVMENANGTLAVDYMQMIAPLVASVQELSARVEYLEAQLE